MRDLITAVCAKSTGIEPGSTRENGCRETFNARFRDKRLNGAIFCRLKAAQILIER